MHSATPVMPEERSGTNDDWMQEDAHLARLCCRPTIPLALLAQGTGTTTPDTCCINQTQAAISFFAPFVNHQRLLSRTAKRAIGLEDEILPREATSFEGGRDRRLAIATGEGLLLGDLGHCRSELGGAYGIRMKLMAQFESDIPDPLCHDLPALLPPGRMTAPTIGVLLVVFICQCRLEGTAMQIQFNDIRSSKCLLRQGGEEEFVDDACTRGANGTLLFGGWMRGHHHPAQHPRRSHRYFGAVIEVAHDLAFWARLDLIGGQMQTCLNERVIEHRVLFAAGDKREARQICEHGSGAILTIEPEEGVFLRELVGS